MALVKNQPCRIRAAFCALDVGCVRASGGPAVANLSLVHIGTSVLYPNTLSLRLDALCIDL